MSLSTAIQGVWNGWSSLRGSSQRLLTFRLPQVDLSWITTMSGRVDVNRLRGFIKEINLESFKNSGILFLTHHSSSIPASLLALSGTSFTAYTIERRRSALKLQKHLRDHELPECRQALGQIRAALTTGESPLLNVDYNIQANRKVSHARDALNAIAPQRQLLNGLAPEVREAVRPVIDSLDQIERVLLEKEVVFQYSLSQGKEKLQQVVRPLRDALLAVQGARYSRAREVAQFLNEGILGDQAHADPLATITTGADLHRQVQRLQGYLRDEMSGSPTPFSVSLANLLQPIDSAIQKLADTSEACTNELNECAEFISELTQELQTFPHNNAWDGNVQELQQYIDEKGHLWESANVTEYLEGLTTKIAEINRLVNQNKSWFSFGGPQLTTLDVDWDVISAYENALNEVFNAFQTQTAVYTGLILLAESPAVHREKFQHLINTIQATSRTSTTSLLFNSQPGEAPPAIAELRRQLGQVMREGSATLSDVINYAPKQQADGPDGLFESLAQLQHIVAQLDHELNLTGAQAQCITRSELQFQDGQPVFRQPFLQLTFSRDDRVATDALNVKSDDQEVTRLQNLRTTHDTRIDELSTFCKIGIWAPALLGLLGGISILSVPYLIPRLSVVVNALEDELVRLTWGR